MSAYMKQMLGYEALLRRICGLPIGGGVPDGAGFVWPDEAAAIARALLEPGLFPEVTPARKRELWALVDSWVEFDKAAYKTAHPSPPPLEDEALGLLGEERP